MTGPRRYSVDLKQGGLELPADFCFTSLNEKLFLLNERKCIGRDEKVSEAKKRSKTRKRKEKEKETENGKIKAKQSEKNM